ncbi:energy-coupling factor transporter transmembrane component T [Devriesea agamarum]|uniref:energy-coupling factor transporter transmembrane component T n=1 Tax=Devriesea agamarum TaxID=472569 RepID=UPI00071E4B76|nr:energy-coupling factor transporter transmembrane component T [Devriesea agamarum]
MFDVRTLVASVVIVDALLLASLPRRIDLVAVAVLALLLIMYRLWRQLGWLLVATVLLVGGAEVLKMIGGSVAGAFGIGITYLWRYCLAGAYGWFLITVVRPTEFMAAMTQIRAPRFLLVPIAVVLRFVPTVVTEARAIGDAMRMRGLIGGPLSVVCHPLRTAEYLVIPLLATAVRSGDELTASALSRGFGGPGRRSTILTLRFSFADIVLAVLVIGVAAYGLGVFL